MGKLDGNLGAMIDRERDRARGPESDIRTLAAALDSFRSSLGRACAAERAVRAAQIDEQAAAAALAAVSVEFGDDGNGPGIQRARVETARANLARKRAALRRALLDERRAKSALHTSWQRFDITRGRVAIQAA